MIAATVIAALAWPSFLKPPKVPDFIKHPPVPAFLKEPLPTPDWMKRGLPIPEHLIPHKRDYALPDPHGEPLAKVEYRADGGLILVPVEIEGKGPYWFALDTGSTRTLVDRSILKSSGLRPRGPASGAAQKLWASNFTVGGIHTFAPEPAAVDLTASPLSGRPVQGFLGSELFKSYIIRIDPARRVVAIYDPVTFRPGNATPIPMTLRGGLLYAPVTIEPRYGDSAVREARIDLGSEDFAADDTALNGQDVRPSLIRDGLEWRWGKAAKVRTVQAGDIALYDTWVGADGDSRLGAGFFNRFETIIDSPHARLWISPTAVSYEPTPEPRTAP